jgi:hypothetical protein
MPYISSMEGRPKIPVEKSIFIDFALGLLSGMKSFFDLFQLLNHNISREETVESPLH